MLVVGRGGRPARAPALVRRAAAVRPPDRRDAVARAGAASSSSMLEERGADAIQAPTIRIAPPEDLDALDRACAEAATLRLDRVHERQRASTQFMRRLLATGDIRDLQGRRGICTIGPATAERARTFRDSGRSDAGGDPCRSDRRRAASSRRSDGHALPAAARRHRARGAGRRAARRRRRWSPRSPPTGRSLAGSRARRRPRHLPDAARSPDRRGHVHERLDGQELRDDLRRRNRRPICCARPSSPRSGRSPPKRRSSSASARRSCRSATRFRIWSTRWSSTSASAPPSAHS